ncbi:hypothetical protein Val02_48960 [Virgisporangium aliadipatigenens]|uniref:Pyrrolo-quinoline quinone repeat domain-containing protein n=1 Tax=Virgisporangium aliadipatigenens TaxID=741659 RepID=A0A8J4DRC9_9ACTN|nr:PQQ-binding-like beta-propeller repeat protein [Virgisporangium aliadipatigenens]GIJ48010.1 hypothetical protein Val02_48960 [Virgisporangium aliadipatigenens]
MNATDDPPARQSDGPAAERRPIGRRALLLGGAAVALGAGGYAVARANRARPGDVRWSYTGIRAAPSLTGKVLVGTGGGVTALNRADGRERWNFSNNTTDSIPGAWDPSFTPAAGDGTVVVAYRSPHLVAFDPGSGKVVWSYAATGDQSFATAPVRDGGTVVAVARSDRAGATVLHGVDTASGSRRWTLALGDVETSTPALAAGRVWLSRANSRSAPGATAGEEWLAVDAASGVVALTLPGAVEFTKPAALASGDRVFFLVDRNLVAMQARTGTVDWVVSAPLDPTTGLAGDQTVLVVLGHDGGLRALDPHNGRRLWEFTETKVTGVPAVSDGSVYAPAAGGQLLILSAKSGTRSAAYRAGTKDLTGPPVITDDSILVTDGDTLRSIVR